MLAVLFSRLTALAAGIPGRVWLGLAGLLAAALLLVSIHNRAFDRGEASARRELEPKLAQCQAEARDLRHMLDVQTKAVKAARAEAEARQEAAQRALRAAEARARQTIQPARTHLRREAPQPAGGALTPAQHKAWEVLQ